MTSAPLPRLLFVTGRLAEFALRQVLEDLAPRAGFAYEVVVLPISVVALAPPKWVARHLDVPPGTDRVILPGHCRGDLGPVEQKANGARVELGPLDLRDLPGFFGQDDPRRKGYGAYSIEILAEINHAPRLKLDEILALARRFREEGADRIDLGCDPGGPWPGVADAVKALRDDGHRVSIDSFDPVEVADAVSAGADLVLSVNATNRERAADWGAEVVVLPDQPGTLDGLAETAAYLADRGVSFRLDPILEPIGFGFSESLGRYLEVRRDHPAAEIMMGVGNLTELTDVDSAGMNTLLIGFCQEQRIGSVLTTAVVNWARSSVREIDLARRLAHYAVTNRALPKRVEPALVALRDTKVPRFGPEQLAELARRIRDPNWRLFAEDDLLHAMNNQGHFSETDPFVLFDRMGVADASHAFYLGFELAKASIALALSKAYRQDEALDWGFLTVEELSHRDRKAARRARGDRRVVGDEAGQPPTQEPGSVGPAGPPA